MKWNIKLATEFYQRKQRCAVFQNVASCVKLMLCQVRVCTAQVISIVNAEFAFENYLSCRWPQNAWQQRSLQTFNSVKICNCMKSPWEVMKMSTESPWLSVPYLWNGQFSYHQFDDLWLGQITWAHLREVDSVRSLSSSLLQRGPKFTLHRMN